MLKDSSKEYFACLLAKRLENKDLCVFSIVEARHPSKEQYKYQDEISLCVDGAFERGLLYEIDSRVDVNTLIEVHTHPFAEVDACFSCTDDKDEKKFVEYLYRTGLGIFYASMVLSPVFLQRTSVGSAERRSVPLPGVAKGA